MASLNSYTQIGRREDLTDKLIQLGDSQAKLLTSFKLRTRTHTMLTQWQDFTLAAPTQNAQIQGFTVTGTYTPRNLRTNSVQISQRPIKVDDTTIEGMTVAGVRSEWEFQSSVAFTQLKRDIEWGLIHNSASTTGASATAAASALALGMFGACTTNSYAPAATSSVFTEDEIITMLMDINSNTGDPGDGLELHTGPLNIKRIMNFTGLQKSQVVGPKDTIHNRTVTIITTNFGNVALVTNIMVGNGLVGVFDFNTWGFVEKVAPVMKKLGRDGDSTTAYWKTEWSIHWLSERSNAVMSGIATA